MWIFVGVILPFEYYDAAEPPVRNNGATRFLCLISYFVIDEFSPYISPIERFLDESILSMSIL